MGKSRIFLSAGPAGSWISGSRPAAQSCYFLLQFNTKMMISGLRLCVGFRTASKLLPTGPARAGFPDPSRWLKNILPLFKHEYKNYDFLPLPVQEPRNGLLAPAGRNGEGWLSVSQPVAQKCFSLIETPI